MRYLKSYNTSWTGKNIDSAMGQISRKKTDIKDVSFYFNIEESKFSHVHIIRRVIHRV